MGILDKLLGNKEKEEESSPDFSGEQNKNLNEGFDQSSGHIPEKPMFGDPGMDDDFNNYGNWQTDKMQNQSQVPPENGNFNENVQIREINENPQMNTQPTQNWSDKNITKDLEIISSKLDAIKSSIESLDHRVRNLERIAEEKQNPPRHPRYR